MLDLGVLFLGILQNGFVSFGFPFKTTKQGFPKERHTHLLSSVSPPQNLCAEVWGPRELDYAAHDMEPRSDWVLPVRTLPMNMLGVSTMLPFAQEYVYFNPCCLWYWMCVFFQGA